MWRVLQTRARMVCTNATCTCSVSFQEIPITFWLEWLWSGERPDDHHRWHRCVYMHCIIRNLCYHQVAKPVTSYNTLRDIYERLSHIPCRVAAAQASHSMSNGLAWEVYYNALTRENAFACTSATQPWVSTRTNRAREWRSDERLTAKAFGLWSRTPAVPVSCRFMADLIASAEDLRKFNRYCFCCKLDLSVIRCLHAVFLRMLEVALLYVLCWHHNLAICHMMLLTIMHLNYSLAKKERRFTPALRGVLAEAATTGIIRYDLCILQIAFP